MPHEDQFTATGPAFTGAGFPNAAFSTNRKGTNCTYGVNVQGSQCGVYGESGLGTDSSRETPNHHALENIGVCGVGLTTGVFGHGDQRAGVWGQHENSGAGVIGVGMKKNNGVFGVSQDPGNHKDDLGAGVGVKGASECVHGVGVMGLSVKEFSNSDTPRAEVGNGGGIGVMGESGSGTGVMGNSNTGVGGVFTSNFAQIRLKPATTVGPPRKGFHEKGEFFVDSRGALFYCVNEFPLRWEQLAGPSFLKSLLSDVVTSVKKLLSREP